MIGVKMKAIEKTLIKNKVKARACRRRDALIKVQSKLAVKKTL